MTVARILSAKGRDVVTAQPDSTLAEVVHLMNARRIGAVVLVGSEGMILGILSERDIVRALAAGGAACLDEAASAHMTRDVSTATEDVTIEHLMNAMTKGRFRHVPVVESGRLVGLVSIGDVVKHRIAEVEGERQALHEYIATA